MKSLKIYEQIMYPLHFISFNVIYSLLIILFQGMVDYRVLQMHSTFEDWMEVTGVSFNPPDSRFYYEPPSQERILLVPGKANNVSKPS